MKFMFIDGDRFEKGEPTPSAVLESSAAEVFPRTAALLRSRSFRVQVVGALHQWLQEDHSESPLEVLVARYAAEFPHLVADIEGWPAGKRKYNLRVTLPAGEGENEHDTATFIVPKIVGRPSLVPRYGSWKYDDSGKWGQLPRVRASQRDLGYPQIEEFGPAMERGVWSLRFSSLLFHVQTREPAPAMRSAIREQLRDQPESTYLPVIKRFLGKNCAIAPKSPKLVARAYRQVQPSTGSLAETQSYFDARWQGRRYPPTPRSRSDRALVCELLNGIHPSYLLKGAGDAEYFVEFDWSGLRAADDPQTIEAAVPEPYLLPDVRVRLKGVGASSKGAKHQRMRLAAILLRWPGGEWESHKPPQGHDEDDETVDFSEWGHVKRVVRMNALLAGETDMHLARAHLATEQYLLALKKAAGPDDALSKLLLPHLRSVDQINNYGNLIILGEHSVLTRGTGLGVAGLRKRLERQLGGVDWHNWQPRIALCDDHHFAVAGQAYWDALMPYVRAHFEKSQPGKWTIPNFFTYLSYNSPSFAEYGGRPITGFVDANEISAPDDGRPLNRHGGSAAMHKGTTTEDLVVASAHAIYHATFFHSWVGGRQHHVGGELRFAPLGVRSRTAPRSAAEWEQFGPRPEHAGMQLLLSEVLSKTEWGYVFRNDEPAADVPDAFREAIAGAYGPLSKSGFQLNDLRARINI